MDRSRAGLLRRRDHLGPVEVALPRRRGAQAHRLVASLEVKRLRVRVRVHGHRLDAERARRSRHPAGDLPAVRDEDLFEQEVKPSGRGAKSTPENLYPAALTALASRAYSSGPREGRCLPPGADGSADALEGRPPWSSTFPPSAPSGAASRRRSGSEARWKTTGPLSRGCSRPG